MACSLSFTSPSLIARGVPGRNSSATSEASSAMRVRPRLAQTPFAACAVSNSWVGSMVSPAVSRLSTTPLPASLRMCLSTSFSTRSTRSACS